MTRSQTQGLNNLVSKTRVIGESHTFQQQFKAFMAMYQEDRARDRPKRERDHIAPYAKQQEFSA